MSNFQTLSQAVEARFAQIASGELFRVNISGDELWKLYLKAFPAGTDPMFRKRTEHDCACCRNFIKNLGGVVAIKEGVLHTVWDIEDFPLVEEPYITVANVMRTHVETSQIVSLFRTKESKYGSKPNFEQVEDGNATIKWDHFHAAVQGIHKVTRPEAEIGDYSIAVHVFKRGLETLKRDDLLTVADLIQDNAIYRGTEFQPILAAFTKLFALYHSQMDNEQKALFIWKNARQFGADFRNTVLGTLLVDLSEGKPLEVAVKAFEAKVAPTNYKRSTALITSSMIDSAMKKIEELGIESALQRRHATLADININNVIWADNSAQAKMKNGLKDLLMESAAARPAKDEKAQPISIDEFMSRVVPSALSMAVKVSNQQQSNLMTLTTAQDPDAHHIFKWDNPFAWTYTGGLTDSIKEKVKRAGGNTDAALRISLGWFNGDDLDLRVAAPGYPTVINFRAKQGVLDVDMNALVAKNSVDPVENASFKHARDGIYQIAVHNYARRSPTNPGFLIEIESGGVITQYHHKKALANGEVVTVGGLRVVDGKVAEVEFFSGMVEGHLEQEVWGIKTERFTKVETLMYSPNFWEGEQGRGNKHWFFMLEGARCPDRPRGFNNEYLTGLLDEHRKVFEVLGSKTLCPPSEQQLTGVGFSSTSGASVLVEVTSATRKAVYKVQF